MYDVNYNFASTNISKLFTRVKDIHNYDTRSPSSQAGDNYYSKFSRPNIQKNSFSCVGVPLWNQIPAHARNLSKKMKKKLKFNHLHANAY